MALPEDDPSSKTLVREGAPAEQPTLVREEPAAASAEEATLAPSEASTLAPPQRDGLAEEAPVTPEAQGRYEVRREYGRGGMSRVLLAFDHHVGREIALKELLPEAADQGTPRSHSQAAATRFLREARITGQLDHPNIVAVHEVGQHPDGTFYYTQKLVRGRTLKAVLRQATSLAERLKLLSHFADICHAVGYAHSRGVIHRDLKPENVMVGEFGETVVLDWGLAKAQGQRDVRAKDVEREALLLRTKDATMAGAALGTPSYMSPEQAAGKLEEIDERSDVWSLGAILYEILTGRPPFDGETAYSIIGKVLRDPVQPVKHVIRDAPAELAAVAERALQRDRTKRYAKAEELAAEIEAWQSGGNVRAYEYSSLDLLLRFVQRNRALTAVIGLALILILAALLAVREEAVRARAALATARHNLARAYVEKAHAAEHDFLWHRAEVFYAAARVQDDTPEARWGASIEGGEASGVTRIAGPSGWVTSVAFAPDGETVAAGSWDATARIFDVSSGRELFRLQAQELIEGVRFSPDRRWLASRDTSGVIRVHDTRTGALAARVTCKVTGPGSLAFDGATLFASCSPQTLAIDLPSGDPRWLPFSSTRLAVCGPGELLVAEERRLIVRKGDGERELGPLDEGRHAIACGDGRFAASVADGRVLLWDETGEALPPLVGHTAGVGRIVFSPDGKRLASASWDRTVRLWDVAGARELESLQRPAPALWVDFAPDGRSIAVGERQSAVVLWTPAAAYVESAGEGAAFAFLDDGGHVAASGTRITRFDADDKPQQTWDAGAAIASISARGNAFVAVRADGAFAFSGPALAWLPGTAVRAQLLESGEALIEDRSGALQRVDAHGQVLRSFPAAPGDWTAAGGAIWRRSARGVDRIDLATGAALPGLDLAATSLTVSRDVAAIGSYAGIQLVRTADLSLAAKLEMDGAVPTTLAFSRDGKVLAAGGIDGAVHLYELAADAEVGHLPVAGASGLTALHFSPDRRLLRVAATVRRGVPAQGRFIHLADPAALGDAQAELREVLVDHGVTLHETELEQVAPPVSARP